MLSAEEALKISRESKQNEYKEMFDEIEKAVKAAAKEGETSLYITGIIPAAVEKKLTLLGYKVTTHNGWVESFATISWNNTKKESKDEDCIFG